MARTLLPDYNVSVYGQGLEGVTNYVNELTNNLMVPAFLLVLYALSIFVWSKSDYKMGAGVFFISLVFFIMSIIAQLFATFNQMIIFIFFVGIIVGIIIHIVETSR